jgi:DNA-binding NtrC family response regulator
MLFARTSTRVHERKAVRQIKQRKQPLGLAGKRVLLVEDEYYIADDLSRSLAEAGAEVIGPCATIAKAEEAISRQAFDCAILDLNLHGQSGVPVADRLHALGIPFAIATGYGSGAVPAHHEAVPRCEKPFDAAEVIELVSSLLAGSSAVEAQP